MIPRGICFAPLALVLSSFACGTTITQSDAGADAPDSADGWTQCTSPDGYAVCNGPNKCTPLGCTCTYGGDPDGLGLCVDKPYLFPLTGRVCAPGFDGWACWKGIGWTDIAFDTAILLGRNGGAAQVRYADLSLWTGDPLPTATTCPDLGNVRPCGGSCGACPGGLDCLGRSPLHPIGVCAKEYGCGIGDPDAGLNGSACSSYATESCFMYLVQPSAQIDADNAGICFPKTDCDALVQKLPGGGKCYGGP